MSKKLAVLLIGVAIGMFLWGQYQGVYEYKKSCEPMGSTATNIEWLECQK